MTSPLDSTFIIKEIPMVIFSFGTFALSMGASRVETDRTVQEENPEMKNPSRIRSLYRSVVDFCVKYPAVLSGYIIYSYLFISTIKFFLDQKRHALSFFDIFQSFDSLFWMWLLALSLVKIINVRTRLYERDREHLRQQQELEMKKVQLNTLIEVVRGLQHEVNNPLTIVSMAAGKLERMGIDNPEGSDAVKTILAATHRIASTLKAFSNAKMYEVDSSPVGLIAKPSIDLIAQQHVPA